MERIHTITGQLFGIFNDPFFIYIRRNFLPTDCTDVIGHISCWYATAGVKLSKSNSQKKKKLKNNKLFA